MNTNLPSSSPSPSLKSSSAGSPPSPRSDRRELNFTWRLRESQPWLTRQRTLRRLIDIEAGSLIVEDGGRRPAKSIPVSRSPSNLDRVPTEHRSASKLDRVPTEYRSASKLDRVPPVSHAPSNLDRVAPPRSVVLPHPLPLPECSPAPPHRKLGSGLGFSFQKAGGCPLPPRKGASMSGVEGEVGNGAVDCSPAPGVIGEGFSSTSTARSSVMSGAISFSPFSCPCGGGVCKVLTSHTANIPGRLYYTCPLPQDKKCSFFIWVDVIEKYAREKYFCDLAKHVKLLEDRVMMLSEENERLKKKCMVLESSNMRAESIQTS